MSLGGNTRSFIAPLVNLSANTYSKNTCCITLNQIIIHISKNTYSKNTCCKTLNQIIHISKSVNTHTRCDLEIRDIFKSNKAVNSLCEEGKKEDDKVYNFFCCHFIILIYWFVSKLYYFQFILFINLKKIMFMQKCERDIVIKDGWIDVKFKEY